MDLLSKESNPQPQNQATRAEITKPHPGARWSGVRIDHHSLEAQGIDRLPEPKLGPERTVLLRRGIKPPEGAQVLDLWAYREHLGRVTQAGEQTQGQIIDLAQARATREARAVSLWTWR